MSIKIKNKHEGSKRGLVMIKLLVEKLQKGLSFLAHKGPDHLSRSNEFDNELEVTTMVSEDVKEGHFVVWTAKGEEIKRFVVELGCLTNPGFLRLLEQAEQEYGFEQTGALTVPCLPHELQKILDQQRCQISVGTGTWATCNNSSIIKGY